MTFSIVARDPATDAVGVAVQSKFISVGSVVPFAAADAGAVATQSFANVAYGPDGLDLLRDGHTASEAIDELVEATRNPRADRSVSSGRTAPSRRSPARSVSTSPATYRERTTAFRETS